MIQTASAETTAASAVPQGDIIENISFAIGHLLSLRGVAEPVRLAA